MAVDVRTMDLITVAHGDETCSKCGAKLERGEAIRISSRDGPRHITCPTTKEG